MEERTLEARKEGADEEALATFEAGNKRLREMSKQQYLDAHPQQHLEQLKKFFVAKRLSTLPLATRRDDIAQPLFVLGFPRSGTTLLEQMLSAHPHIVAGTSGGWVIRWRPFDEVIGPL